MVNEELKRYCQRATTGESIDIGTQRIWFQAINRISPVLAPMPEGIKLIDSAPNILESLAKVGLAIDMLLKVTDEPQAYKALETASIQDLKTAYVGLCTYYTVLNDTYKQNLGRWMRAVEAQITKRENWRGGSGGSKGCLWVFIVILVILCILAAVFGGISKKSMKQAQEAIQAISTVDSSSGEAIQAAREAYEEAVDQGHKKALRDELKILEQAEADYMEACASDSFYEAFALYDTGKYREAKAAFEEVAQQYPDSEKAKEAPYMAGCCLLDLAESEYIVENYDAALDICEEGKAYEDQGLLFSDITARVYAAMAEDAFDSGDLIKAANLLSQADAATELCPEADYVRDQLESALASKRPANGKVFTNKLKWGQSEFTVKSDDSDAFVKLESLDDPEKYVTFYVRANSSATVRAPDGNYVAKYTVGDFWFGEEDMFGPDAPFSKADSILTFSTSFSGNYVQYSTITITLYSVIGGNMSTSDIQPGDF